MNNANIYRIQQGQLNEFNHNSLIPNPSPFPDGQSGAGVGQFVKSIKRGITKNNLISKSLGVAGLAASVLPIPGARAVAAPLIVGSKIAKTVGYGAMPGDMGEYKKTQMRVKRAVKKAQK